MPATQVQHAPLYVSRALNLRLNQVQQDAVPDTSPREALGELLQSALELEFSTIPPYLAAAFSLLPSNERIQRLILRVAQEEMLHLTAVANVMNAIGVAPNIAAAVSAYPHELDLLDPPLKLDLKSFSLDLVRQLMMRIETPEHPTNFPVAALLAESHRPATIGQFYAGIIQIIQSGQIAGLFDDAEKNAFRQVIVVPNFRKFAYLNEQDSQNYPLKPDIDFHIKDAASAVRHLEWIIDQGEGTTPLDPQTAEGIPAHYYRFESIVNQRYLAPDKTVELAHSFRGASLPFDPSGVHEFDTNPKLADYVSTERVARHMKRFNQNYTGMVNDLQIAFNCPDEASKPAADAAYQSAIDNMRAMPSIATAIVQNASLVGIKAGMPFEYGGRSPL